MNSNRGSGPWRLDENIAVLGPARGSKWECHIPRRTLLARVALALSSICALGATETPNTGMADPAALINAFDRFVATLPVNGGGRYLVMPLTTLRGITSGVFNAGGSVRIDLTQGSVGSQVSGLPPNGSFDLWLVDNRPSPGHTTLAESQDVLLKVGSYHVESGAQTLSVNLGAQRFSDFLPDRAFVTPSGQSPSGNYGGPGFPLFHSPVRQQLLHGSGGVPIS